MRPTHAFLALLALLLTVSVAPMAAAQGETVEATVVAVEEDCPDGNFYCWETEGLDGVQPGDTVNVTVSNPADNRLVHNLYVRFSAEHQQDTAAEAAEANTSNLAPGEETNLTFTVPDDATNVYYWCDVPPHEAQGMWGLIEFQAGDGGDGNGGGNGDDAPVEDDEQESPGLGASIALATVAAAALAMARRRS